ncbi:MAG: hypothetical protein JOZ52_14210 [Acidobacteria bacterium]|nr:hypothetical protein [Acidobacteriota bacterium]
MASRKEQSKAGIPPQPRGQEMGDERSINQDESRKAKEETPALRGRRKTANKLFADKSKQHETSDAATPRSNTPSLPAQTGGGHIGESGGERAFKKRQAKKR